jgi:uncharacterized BrkB/YihY/UPF0761 family membrane protein
MEEGRPFWKLRPWQILITLALIFLLAVSAIAVVVTGPLADQVGKLFGLESTTVTIWDVAKWPVIVLIVMTAIAILYYAAPNVSQPGFRWITPGGILAVLLWILASLAFALYVANFASYNKTYGSLAGAVAGSSRWGSPRSERSRWSPARTPDPDSSLRSTGAHRAHSMSPPLASGRQHPSRLNGWCS